ncbi:MAG: glycosyltransferase family 4 protein [Bacteroidota bacterium]
MKLLILTQYFPPEVGAPQNRLFELAVRLKNKGIDVTVFTAMPNYPQMVIHKAYKNKIYYKEQIEGITVHRSWIFVSNKKNIVLRLLNYFSFVFTSLIFGIFKTKKTDFILCESPPLFLGITAYLLSKFKRSNLIFNVSDLWPESAEKLGLITNKFLLGITTKLEEFLYRKSKLITGQTQGIVKDISDRFPNKKVYWLKNGVDIKLYDNDKIQSDWREKNGFKSDDFIALYAGIIGHAQGLETILYAADNIKENKYIKFVFIGSGPVKETLLKIKEEKGLDNVYFFDLISKSEIPNVLKAINISIIPLKKLDLFKGAIPSKIFEVLAMRKAIMLGVEGEAKELFIDDAKAGLAYEPENYIDLADKITDAYNNPDKLIELGNNGYDYVKQYFSRDIIAHEFWEFLNENK